MRLHLTFTIIDNPLTKLSSDRRDTQIKNTPILKIPKKKLFTWFQRPFQSAQEYFNEKEQYAALSLKDIH